MTDLEVPLNCNWLLLWMESDRLDDGCTHPTPL
jgi:hypothetical protein